MIFGHRNSKKLNVARIVGHPLIYSDFYPACEYHWIPFSQKCYQYFSTMKSWSDAQTNCNAIAPAGKIGHLASVPNEETNIFLSNITSDRLWIGGYLNSEGNWAWMDNSTWTFDAFAQGQSCNEYLDLNLNLCT